MPIVDLDDLEIKYKEDAKLTIKMLASNVLDSKSLAAYVVLYKSLKVGKKFAIFCMSELAYRRSLGEEFDFEGFIEEEVKKVPIPQPMPDVSSFFSLKNLKALM